tara:strand:+ start:51 stop:539 length:489 start_codon:yes stop_codon:yes gene_type:complete
MIKKNLLNDFLIIIIIFLIDRLTKFYVIFLNEKNNGLQIYSSKFLNIELYWNSGIAFGLFSFSENNLYNYMTLLIVLVILVIVAMTLKSKDFTKLALLIILGGAIGNLFDRIIYKSVPDFIDIHFGDFHWFIFNVADIFISLGVIFMILIEIIGKKRKNNEV